MLSGNPITKRVLLTLTAFVLLISHNAFTSSSLEALEAEYVKLRSVDFYLTETHSLNESDKAILFLKKSSEMGHLSSKESLGFYYLGLYPRKPSSDQSYSGYKLIVSAAMEGLATSQMYLGLCFLDGDCGYLPNKHHAQYWLTKASDSGHPNADFFLQDLKSREQAKNSNSTQICETHNFDCLIEPFKVFMK